MFSPVYHHLGCLTLVSIQWTSANFLRTCTTKCVPTYNVNYWINIKIVTNGTEKVLAWVHDEYNRIRHFNL